MNGSDDARDTRDRVVRMEVEIKGLTTRVALLETKVDNGFRELETKIDRLSALLHQELGERATRDRVALFGLSLARWAAGAVIVVATALVTNIDRVSRIVAWLTS